MGTATPVRDAPQGPPTKGMSMTAIEAAFHPDSAELAASRRRHDLMVELFRVDRAREQALAHHQPEKVARLEHFRDRIAESLAALAS